MYSGLKQSFEQSLHTPNPWRQAPERRLVAVFIAFSETMPKHRKESLASEKPKSRIHLRSLVEELSVTH